MSSHVLVVGAGVIGAATALSLAEQGFKVTIIDRAGALNKGASGLNGGQLSYSYTDALASPETLRSFPKLLFGLDESFRLSANLSIDFLNWGFQFLANCTADRADANTLEVLTLATRSHVQMNEWIEKYSFQFQHNKAQKLHLYESAKALDSAKRRVELKNQYGANQSVLDGDQVLEIDPALERMNAKLVGAVYSPNDEVGDVVAFTQAAIDKSLSLGKGTLKLNTKVLDIRIEGGTCRSVLTNSGEIEADHIVICAGYESSQLLRKIGIKSTPIVPVAGYSVTYPETTFTPNVSLTDTAKKIVLCHLGSQLRVAGMADVGRVALVPPKKRLELLKRIIQNRFPDAGDYSVEPKEWSGMRPMTPSSKPIICQTKVPNIFVNSGHGMLGWTLAAGAAKDMQEIVVKYANSKF